MHSLRTARPAFGIDTGGLVRALREQGAYLPQDETAGPGASGGRQKRQGEL